MPREARFLLFSMLELREAAQLHLRSQRRSAANVAVAVGELQAKPEVRLRIHLGDGAEAEAVWLAGSELAAALIRYCRQRRLPLPARGGKWLQATPRGIVLGVSSGLARQELAGLLECPAAEPQPAPGERAAAQAGTGSS